jgi:phosphatidylethanolamine-binding protein (PEBP) family uncharacterized protein
LNVDPDIESSGTEAVNLANFFKAPSITTNQLPSGLTDTLKHPSWTIFPDPTFNGILPNMTNAKLDKFLRWDSLPLAAPASLSGRIVEITTDDGDGWWVYFGASTFVQGGDWYGSQPAMVGNYTYAKTGATTAHLAMTVVSSGFSNGGTIPATYVYTNANFSPPLAWKAVPPGTQSFALLADDLDANTMLDDTMFHNLAAVTQSDLENAMDGHVLGFGVLTGTYTGR